MSFGSYEDRSSGRRSLNFSALSTGASALSPWRSLLIRWCRALKFCNQPFEALKVSSEMSRFFASLEATFWMIGPVTTQLLSLAMLIHSMTAISRSSNFVEIFLFLFPTRFSSISSNLSDSFFTLYIVPLPQPYFFDASASVIPFFKSFAIAIFSFNVNCGLGGILDSARVECCREW